MTAITLNLLAEEQLAARADARDPFKATLAICAVVFALLVMSGSVLSVKAGQKRTEASLLQKRCDNMTAAAASGEAANFRSVKSLADDIIALNHARPLYAQQLALIHDLLPDSIQLTRISFTLTAQVSDPGSAAPADDETADKGKPRPVAAPKNVSHLVLQLDGKATSSRPELEVDTLMQTLRGNAAFSEGVSQIQLRSIARGPAPSGSEPSTLPSAQFVIECQY